MSEKFPPHKDRQEVAYIFATSLRQVKNDRRAAAIFAKDQKERPRKEAKKAALAYLKDQDEDKSLLSGEERTSLLKKREELARSDQTWLDEKRGNFSVIDRGILVVKVDSKYLSGFTKEERVKLYKKAGYTEDEISNVTGEKVVFSNIIGNALTPVSEVLRTGAAAMGGAMPLMDQIPNNSVAAGLAVAAYVGSLGAATEINLKLTKEAGTSPFNTLTTTYYVGDKLFKNKTRDWMARVISQGGDYFLHMGIVGGMAAFSDGDLRKVTAASLAMAAYNGVVGGASEVWRRMAGKEKK